MKIMVDENVPYGREAFGVLGEVVTAHGRKITRELLADIDALVVRSITKVNQSLLEGTPVRFVGTCTIGEDHIDKSWLAGKGVRFTSAPGCNANSVGDYITAALFYLAEKHGFSLAGKRLGIIGVGNVGSKVWRKAEALGMTCVLCDPPRAEKEGDTRFRPLEELLDCDLLTFHVPMEKYGPYPTWHLADADFLARMKAGAILINSSRGGVVDNQALKAALRSGRLRGAVLDVWEGEPNPDPELLALTDIATPHIAGYSFDGKVNGTRQVYEALCDHLGVPVTWDPAPLLPAPETPSLAVDPSDPAGVSGAVRAVYDILSDDKRMRALPELSTADEQAALFDRLRKEYPRRREYFNTICSLIRPDAAVQAMLEGIGFRCA